MSFTSRSVAPSDFETCVSILREGFAFDPPRKKKLLQLWKQMDAEKAFISVAVEDRRLPAAKRVVGFGLSVFVTDAFARKIKAGAPFVSREFLDQWAKGERPYLLRKEVGEANSGEGLNLLVLHYGWREDFLSAEDLAKVRLKQTEAFIQNHAGYKSKEYLHEVFGPELRDFVLAAGSLLRHDYAGRKWKTLLARTAKKDWPYLTGFTAAEVMARSGTAASIFQAKGVAPHFGFSAGEQDMLARALTGETDERLAKSLGLSPWTIKKRWQAVYLKVAKADASILEEGAAREKSAGDRSLQKRRYLMEYLRHHPEELRPQSPRKA